MKNHKSLLNKQGWVYAQFYCKRSKFSKLGSCKTKINIHLKKIPFLIFANKQDLISALSPEEVIILFRYKKVYHQKRLVIDNGQLMLAQLKLKKDYKKEWVGL